MGIIELLLISLGLAMDAFAVSVTNGMYDKRIRLGMATLIALTFGAFQGIMPTIGYVLGQSFAKYVNTYDHYIALILLSFIGGKMIFEAIKESKEKSKGNEVKQMALSFGVLMVQGIATSIDALAVGVSFSAMKVNIVTSAAVIAAVTFVCSFAGVFIGKKFGSILNSKAQIIGGVILILIGAKIFVEHMFL